jgi:2-desacetyl-2-hydroxyethyl bacteriochlorophyllide A dehydrogenase
MKAIVCDRPFSLQIEERPLPLREAGEVMIRIRRVGLCGTDYHIFSGNQPFLTYPRIMGHELAGEVAEANEGSTLRVGQLVTINPYIPCGQCVACRKSKPNCCVSIKVLGVHVDGGMTEFICVPAAAVIAVDGLTPDQAAMVEFLSVGAHAVRRGQTTQGDRALVVGAGPIGVGVALFCQFAGAEVTLIDTSAERLDYARDRVGIDHVAQLGDGLEDVLKARTDGEFFDVVFDATGNGKAIEKGFSYVAHGGRYVLVSVVKDMISFSDPEFHKRETTLLGSRNATREDFEYVIEKLLSGAIPSEILQTHNFDLMDTPTMIKDLMANQGSVLKAIATF